MKKAHLCLLCTWLCVWSVTLFLTSAVQAQPAGTTNFYDGIKSYNLATLWHADRLRWPLQNHTEAFPEPYGILGKNHQRFYIHYTAVTKDPANPYRYQVQGKTRVGNQVRPFTGTITVTQAGIYKANSLYAPESYKGYKRGQLVCRVELNETVTAPGSGAIKGTLTTNFCINSQNQLLYDTLDFGQGTDYNNQFKGTLTTYNSKAPQALQWGDYTIRDSKFDDMDGLTVPAEYEKYGWKSFVDAIPNDLRPASKAAIAEEKRQWWK
ncbi:hypothetical protein KHS38_21875 [Mucilaginibacter sp. Bleaf8]|uniref:hypothetical protein n=1 Tax=Mucilaginibacter sp. Bleaf8 TaxID=2834430 RepID=UPI001BCF6327|nr:hypothetical protein [Mucilaginibacter sp. Bleaf8]MBS7567069.1 hypothetical protein [Mucilaginibacter sp. Bleaf8]